MPARNALAVVAPTKRQKLGLSPAEFARESGIPEERVYRMVEGGTLAADRTTRRILIPRSELVRWARGAAPGLDEERLLRLVRQAVREELQSAFGKAAK